MNLEYGLLGAFTFIFFTVWIAFWMYANFEWRWSMYICMTAAMLPMIAALGFSFGLIFSV